MPSVPTSIDIHPDIAVAWSLQLLFITIQQSSLVKTIEFSAIPGRSSGIGKSQTRCDYFSFDLLGEPLLLVRRPRTETCVASITFAVTGPVPRPKGAVPESCSAVHITGGPMGSTDACECPRI